MISPSFSSLKNHLGLFSSQTQNTVVTQYSMNCGRMNKYSWEMVILSKGKSAVYLTIYHWFYHCLDSQSLALYCILSSFPHLTTATLHLSGATFMGIYEKGVWNMDILQSQTQDPDPQCWPMFPFFLLHQDIRGFDGGSWRDHSGRTLQARG